MDTETKERYDDDEMGDSAPHKGGRQSLHSQLWCVQLLIRPHSYFRAVHVASRYNRVKDELV